MKEKQAEVILMFLLLKLHSVFRLNRVNFRDTTARDVHAETAGCVFPRGGANSRQETLLHDLRIF